ncbi:response regulator [Pseudoclavibacter helvolus]|uniref:response regulator n=1 Tax=Pseudoclavibacter helvolus TaxID=255205 RepID=UPI003C72CB7D
MTAVGKGAVPEYRAAVVEDHVLQRRRTVELLESDGFNVVVSVESLPELVAWLRSKRRELWPSLLVLDLMVDRGTDAEPELVRELSAHMSILVLSAMASPELVKSVLAAGVRGVVGKRDSEAEILEAARAVLKDEEWMTTELASVIARDPGRPKLGEQEERAMILYATGLTLNDVAAIIGVKPDTAKKYLARVKIKYAQVGRPLKTKVDFHRAAQESGYFRRDELH